MNKKILILAGAFLGLALILWLVPKLFLKAPETPATTENTNTQQTPATTENKAFPLSDADIVSLSSQAKKEFDNALIKAREWKSDAMLTAVVIKYKDGIDIKNGKDSYIFQSPSLPTLYFDITFDQMQNADGKNNYERLVRFKEDFFLPGDVSVMPMQYWKFSYPEILKQVDELGGIEVRNKNEKYDVNLVLYAITGDYLTWRTEYLVGSDVLTSISVNAYTGEEL